MKKVFIDQPLEERVILDEKITHHILHVLRHKINETFCFGNYQSQVAFYILEEENERKSIWLRQSDIMLQEIHSPIILIQSFLKGDKFEYVIQKVTELDVSAIIGISTKNCVAKYNEKKLSTKEERWNKIIKEASQQCNRTSIAKYTMMSSFSDLDIYLKEMYPQCLRLVAYENEEKIHIKALLREYYEEQDSSYGVAIIIGPEGGFDEKEIEELNALAFKSVTLGSTILRAETAAISSIAMINYERS